MKVFKVEILSFVGFALIAANTQEEVLTMCSDKHKHNSIITEVELLTANVNAPCIICDCLTHSISAF